MREREVHAIAADADARPVGERVASTGWRCKAPTWLVGLVALGLCPSKGEARRKIAEGAIRVDDQVVSDPALEIAVTAPIKLSFGKKKHGLLVPA